MTRQHLAKAEVLAPLIQLEMVQKEADERIKKLRVLIAGLLRSSREKQGVTLREVARRMGLSAAYVSDVELGRRHCTIKFADLYMESLYE